MKLSRFTSKGWLPTNIVELAELIGCSSQNAAAEHVKALKKKVTYPLLLALQGHYRRQNRTGC
jgi:SOS-response transcriptional repressor LexA